jgi:hypothetical protein
MGQHGDGVPCEVTGLEATALTAGRLRDWLERDDRPPAVRCPHPPGRSFVAGPVRVCRDCGTTEQDEPLERPLVAQDEAPGRRGRGPGLAEQAARVAARRRLDQQADRSPALRLDRR